MAVDSRYYYEKGHKEYVKNISMFEFQTDFSEKIYEKAELIEKSFSLVDPDELDDKQEFTYRLCWGNICMVLYKKMVKDYKYVEAIRYCELGVKTLTEINYSYFNNDPVLSKDINRRIANFFNNMGNACMSIQDYDRAYDAYYNAAERKSIPSMFNFASLCQMDNMPFYNKALALDYYIKILDTEIDMALPNCQKYQLFKYMAASNAGRLYFDQKEYQSALKMFEMALDGVDLCGKEKNDIKKYLNGRISVIKKILSNTVEFSPKHEYVLSLFTDKAKKHLKNEHYIYIETSLLVKDFLDNNKYHNLDYSSAIMPILKCVESILFDVIGQNYLSYLKGLDTLDYRKIPKQFIINTRNGKNIIDSVEQIELGGFLFIISSDFGNSINEYFTNYMRYRGINHNDSEYLVIWTKLREIKDNFRNPAAHKNMVDSELASSCIDYLLYETIRFINTFLELFY